MMFECQILFPVMIHHMPLLLHVIDSLKLTSECSSGVIEACNQWLMFHPCVLQVVFGLMSTEQQTKPIL